MLNEYNGTCPICRKPPLSAFRRRIDRQEEKQRHRTRQFSALAVVFPIARRPIRSIDFASRPPMPEMGGIELIRTLHLLRPDLKSMTQGSD